LQGQGPFELVYRHTRNGATSRHTLKSAQDTGVLHLATEPGSHRYDVLEISDANYGSQTLQTPIAVSHEINSRPSVSFGRQNTRKLCLDSGLSSDAKIYFEGKAPFDVQLSVRRPASLRVDTYDINVGKSEWTLDIPQHILKDIGRHEITITKMSDSTGCEWIVHDLDRLSTTIEVVESARIVPVSQVKDLCVGDTLGFELQGTAPWSVE
jgi:nucleoporin POM152